MPVEICLAAHEVLLEQPRIAVTFKTPIDAESAIGALRVVGVRGGVVVSRDGKRAVSTPEAPLPPGTYQLEIGGRNTKRGKSIPARASIPFHVVAFKARVDRGQRIESMVRLRFELDGSQRLPLTERPKGAFIDIVKVTSRSSDKPSTLAFNQLGRPVHPHPGRVT